MATRRPVSVLPLTAAFLWPLRSCLSCGYGAASARDRAGRSFGRGVRANDRSAPRRGAWRRRAGRPGIGGAPGIGRWSRGGARTDVPDGVHPGGDLLSHRLHGTGGLARLLLLSARRGGQHQLPGPTPLRDDLDGTLKGSHTPRDGSRRAKLAGLHATPTTRAVRGLPRAGTCRCLRGAGGRPDR
jgi:hypothetical protein